MTDITIPNVQHNIAHPFVPAILLLINIEFRKPYGHHNTLEMLPKPYHIPEQRDGNYDDGMHDILYVYHRGCIYTFVTHYTQRPTTHSYHTLSITFQSFP